MQSWSKLLESFHSALIDELNSAYPNLLPELGLPTKIKTPSWLEHSGHVTVSFTDSQGWVALDADRDCQKLLKQSINSLLENAILRAKNEFKTKGIAPTLGPVLANAPEGASQIICLPMRLNGHPLRLHIAIA